MQCVILAAGSGTRMQPLTLTRSKVMLPLANRPYIEWLAERLPSKDIVIVVSRSQKDIIENMENFGGCDFAYQPKPLGSGDALRAAEEHVSGKFVAVNGDEFFAKKDFADIKKHELAIAVKRVEDVSEFGSVCASSGALVAIGEKAGAGAGLANCGLYALDERIFGALRKIKKSPRGEYELTDAVNLLARESPIKIHEAKEWRTLSFPWHILDINAALLEENGALIADSAEIRSGAVLEGPVAIGEHAVVGPNCFIRACSSIGARCKIGQAVEVKNSVIMDNTFVSHSSYVGDSIIGANCNVAAGTMFANLRLDEKNVIMNFNGQRVDSGRKKLGGIAGDGVKFGTSVTVMPGKKVWPNIMVPPRALVSRDIKKQPPLGRGGNEK